MRGDFLGDGRQGAVDLAIVLEALFQYLHMNGPSFIDAGKQRPGHGECLSEGGWTVHATVRPESMVTNGDGARVRRSDSLAICGPHAAGHVLRSPPSAFGPAWSPRDSCWTRKSSRAVPRGLAKHLGILLPQLPHRLLAANPVPSGPRSACIAPHCASLSSVNQRHHQGGEGDASRPRPRRSGCCEPPWAGPAVNACASPASHRPCSRDRPCVNTAATLSRRPSSDSSSGSGSPPRNHDGSSNSDGPLVHPRQRRVRLARDGRLALSRAMCMGRLENYAVASRSCAMDELRPFLDGPARRVGRGDPCTLCRRMGCGRPGQGAARSSTRHRVAICPKIDVECGSVSSSRGHTMADAAFRISPLSVAGSVELWASCPRLCEPSCCCS